MGSGPGVLREGAPGLFARGGREECAMGEAARRYAIGGDGAAMTVLGGPWGVGDYLILGEISETCVSFRCHECVAMEDGSPRYASGVGPGWTGDPSQAEPCLEGFVRWDGCSNWTFHRDHETRHFCGRGDVEQYCGLLLRLYGLAARLIPDWDDPTAS